MNIKYYSKLLFATAFISGVIGNYHVNILGNLEYPI